MVKQAIGEAGKEVDPEVEKIFTRYRKTHNDAVFDIYTPRIRAARSSHIITGLPDAYGRGRIIGDYRRVALYLSLIHISEPTRRHHVSRMPSSA